MKEGVLWYDVALDVGWLRKWAGACGYGSYYSLAAAGSFSRGGLVHLVIDVIGNLRRIPLG